MKDETILHKFHLRYIFLRVKASTLAYFATNFLNVFMHITLERAILFPIIIIKIAANLLQICCEIIINNTVKLFKQRLFSYLKVILLRDMAQSKISIFFYILLKINSKLKRYWRLKA